MKFIKICFFILSPVFVLGQNYYQMACDSFYIVKNYEAALKLSDVAIEKKQEVAISYMIRGASKYYLKDYVGANIHIKIKKVMMRLKVMVIV